MLTFLTTMLLSGFTAGASSGSGGYSTIQDEGTPQTQRSTVNFTGAGVSCTDSGGITVCTISGGGAGSGNFQAVNVDFGSGGDTLKSVSVSAAWVTSTSVINCDATGVATASRAEGAEDAVIEGIACQTSNRSAGVGFTLKCSPRQGRAYGIFVVHCSGGTP